MVLNDTAITDAGMERLGQYTKLEALELRGTKITGKALSYLQALPRLSYLNLCGNEIDDDDIDELNEICSLVSVWLTGTRVTDHGLTKLHVFGSLSKHLMDDRTLRALAETTELDFASQPFADIIEYLKQRHEVEIQFDPKIDEQNLSRKPITSSRRGVLLFRTLEELLAPLNLVLVYRYNVLLIMTRPVKPALHVPQLADGEQLSPRLVSALSQDTELDFADQPLSDVMRYLAARHNIEIHIDDDAFRRARRSPEVPVSRSVKGIPLQSALGLLLEPLDMTCVAEGETLVIRPASENSIPSNAELENGEEAE